VSVHDRALNYGDGLFESIRIASLQPVLASLHWQRLQVGLQVLGIDLQIATVERQLHQLIALAAAAGHRHGVIKIIVSRGDGGRGFAPARGGRASVLCRWHPLPAYSESHYQRGVALQLCQTRLPHRPGLAGLKHLNCLEYVLASRELPVKGQLQGLLLDQDDLLIETTSANIFLVHGGQLSTPLLHRCGVAGTMRRWIIETLAARMTLHVAQRELPLSALYEAEEVFICNSVFGVMPISCLAQHNWDRGAITGAIQEQVMKLFHD
jgi:4-amino-4-deoxychorismate lyase